MYYKIQIAVAVALALAIAVLYWVWSPSGENTINDKGAESEAVAETDQFNDNDDMETINNVPSIHPVEHASFVMKWKEAVVYFDPVGDAEDYLIHGTATVIFITDIHGDHLDVPLLEELVTNDIALIAPQAVATTLPPSLIEHVTVMNNGDRKVISGLAVEAIPMYNLPGESENFHVKGRGNGYVLETDGIRVYNGGDTAAIPEMLALKNIDIAFIPMNLPYTMDIDEAAKAVIAFAPKTVYPFHYRGPNGLSSVEEFRSKVQAADPDIEVVLADWY